jgi:hypothetical protein
VLVPLAQHGAAAAAQVEVADAEASHLGGPGARVEQEEDERLVAPAILRLSGSVPQRLDLLRGERLDLVGARDRPAKLGYWRDGQGTLRDHELEEGVEVIEVEAGGGGAQGLAPVAIAPLALFLLVDAVEVSEEAAEFVQADLGPLASEEPEELVPDEGAVGERAAGELAYFAVKAPAKGVVLQIGEGKGDLRATTERRTVAL